MTGIMIIIGSFKSILNKTVIPIAIILLFIPSGIAVDNNFSNPMSISRYQSAGIDYFLLVNNNASNGYIDSAPLSDAGYFTPRNVLLDNGNNLLDAKADPTTTDRIFGTDEQGNVFYFSANVYVDYSLGFYTCCDEFGNPTNSNPLYKIGTRSATTYKRNIAFDSSGNVYTHDGLLIYKYTKDSIYAESLAKTMVAGTDFPAQSAFTTAYIEDIKITTNGNIMVAIGEYTAGPGGVNDIISISVLNSDFTTNHYHALETYAVTGAGEGTHFISIIPDATNQTENFTIAYEVTSTTGTPGEYIYHVTGTTKTAISNAPLTGITSFSTIEYFNSQIFLASPAQNLIRAYGTNFEGLFTEGTGALSQLTYLTHTLDSVESIYGLNQPVELVYTLSIFPFDSDMSFNDFKNDYFYEIALYDSNGLKFFTQTIPSSAFVETGNFIDGYGADASGSYTFQPAGNWTTGNQTGKLWEVKSNTNIKALLDTETIIIDTNMTNSDTNVTVITPITSGSGLETLNQWDSYVGMMGMGVNSISKLLFALIIITVIALMGMKLAGGESAMVGAFAPYIYFTYIEYIPKWIFIILIIMLVLKSKIFR